MSGSHKPGATFKILVVSTGDNTAIIQGEEEDIAYLQAGKEYVAHFTAVGNGNDSGGDE